ncbi:MAG: Beta-barrel assembly-enhancing protease [Planctomycetes bacterium]|nr:Beta-barrel assembly-enhancing protease [Planctomycetota bacterium]
MFIRACLYALLALTLGVGVQSARVLCEPEAAKDGETPGEQADADYVKAALAVALGQYDEALELIAKYIKRNPDEADGYTLRGTIHSAKGDYSAAKSDFEQALKLDKNYVEAHIGLARLAYLQDSHVAARKHLDDALALQPKNVEALTLYGDTWYYDDEYAKAIEKYTSALDAKPDHPGALYGRSRCRYLLKEYEDALGDVDLLLEKSPLHGKGWVLKGDVHRNLDQWPEAEKAYNRALLQREEHYSVFVNLGYVIMEQGRHGSAIGPLHEAIELRPNAVTPRGNLTTCLMELGRLEDALEQSNLTLLCDDADARHLRQRAEILDGLERKTDAAAAWKQAHQTDKESLHGRVGYAEALQKLHRHDEAVKVLEAGDHTVPRVAAVLSDSLLNLHRREDALRVLEDADPSGGLMLPFLAQKVQVLGYLYRFDEMDEVGKQIDKLMPGMGLMVDSMSLLGQGKLKDCLDALESDSWPEWLEPLRLGIRADVQGMLGELDAAEAGFQQALSLERSSVLLRNYSKHLVRVGRIDDALTWAEEAVKNDAWDDAAQLALGNVLLAKSDWSAAAKAFTRAREVNPYSTEALLNRAEAYLAMGLSYDAAKDIEAAFKLDPHDHSVLTARALITTRRDGGTHALPAIEAAEQRIEWVIKQGVSSHALVNHRVLLCLLRAELAGEDADAAAAECAKAIAALREVKEAGLYLSESLKSNPHYKLIADNPAFLALWKK